MFIETGRRRRDEGPGARGRAAPVRSDRCEVCGVASVTAYSTDPPARRCLRCWTKARDAAQATAERPRWPAVASGHLTVHPSGCLTCHQCGTSYANLGSHVRLSHGLSPAAYREKFNLPADVDLRARRHRDHEPSRCPKCGEDRLIEFDAALDAFTCAVCSHTWSGTDRREGRGHG